jgi:hypothetical protein
MPVSVAVSTSAVPLRDRGDEELVLGRGEGPGARRSRRGDHHRGVEAALPHWAAFVTKAYPKDNEPGTFGVDDH